MSYIAFDLDALNVVPDVAAASGLPAGDVAHGLLKLWAWCFRNKTDVVTEVHLAGFFGKPSAPALSAFGFLEPAGTSWRVKGADRYLRVAEARRRGGLKSKGNLIPGGRQSAENDPRLEPSASREAAERDPRLGLGSLSALTPSTEHRAPNRETTTLSSTLDLGVTESTKPVDPEAEAERLASKLTDDEWQVFQHWRVTLGHPKAVASADRKKLIAKWLPVYGVDRLQAAVDGCSRSAHHMGQNDRHRRYDSLELILRDAKNIEDFEAMSGRAAA